MTRVVVCGYATLDYVVQMADVFHGTGTALGELGPNGVWPRAGAAALYTSKRLALSGHECHAITWVGPDNDGDHYLEACQASGVRCEGIDIVSGTRTTRCILVYQPDGSYGCIIDIDESQTCTLRESQRLLITNADMVCVAIGPPKATKQILDLCTPEQKVAWIAKIDHASAPFPTRQRLADRANYIFCNASEREFVEESRGRTRPNDQLIIETLGSAGVLIDFNQTKSVVLPTKPLKTSDTTGAGDTLAGETLAYLTNEPGDVTNAVQAGMNAARALLLSRPCPNSNS